MVKALRTFGRMIVGLAALSVASPVSAHHSLAMYDRSKKITLSGTVKEFDWANPHSFIRVVVPKPDGKTEIWSFEGAGVNTLSRVGWTKEMLHPGDKISVRYSPRSDGKMGGGLFQSIVTADGKTWTQPFGEPPSAAVRTTEQSQ